MFSGLGNLGSVLKQAQEMGGKLQSINEQMKQQTVSGNAGGGMVEVVVNGLGEVLQLKIDPVLVDKGEREMIEDLVPAAINQAQTRAKQLHTEAMKSLTAGLEIPGLSDALSNFTGGPPPDSNS